MRWAVLAVVLIILGVATFFLMPNEASAPLGSESVPESMPAVTDDGTAAEAYVRANIGQLSPQPAVLGGTFYVTEIEAANGAGTVSYEDGHIALTADFMYALTDKGVSVNAFTIREN